MIFRRLTELVFVGALAFNAGAVEVIVRVAPPHYIVERRGPRRVPSLERQRVCLGSRTLGTASAAARSLGSPPLGFAAEAAGF
jgi:hypothetical protein